VGGQQALPEAVRGVVGDGAAADSVRIEHVWKDPGSGVTERQLSDWHEGSPPSKWRNHLFVSPSGRHAVVVEQRQHEEEDGVVETNYARRIELRPTQPRPDMEPDVDAERAADRKNMALPATPPSDPAGESGDCTDCLPP